MQDTRRRSSSSAKIHYPRFTRAELIDRLTNSIRELSTSIPVREAYLIGSYAKGNYTASSDIDILVVVEREEPDTYKKIYKTIRLPRLELLLYNSNEYIIMRNEQPKTIEKLLENAIRII